MVSRAPSAAAHRPLIAHVVYRFDVGGMENGLVNLINGLPEGFADHCVVALTESSAAFSGRVARADVRVIALNKRPGQTFLLLPRLVRLFRSLRPDVVHTRNVGTLEVQLAAWATGVPVRIHGEHGWDVGDLAGENRRMLWVRRLMKPLVHHQIALSGPTHRYLLERVGVPESRVTNICNGVDTKRFSPADDRASIRAALAADDATAQRLLSPDAFVVGAVGRLAAVKNPALLVDAFASVCARNAEFARCARLALVGDGHLYTALRAQLQSLGLSSLVWMPGSRDDVPACLQALDLLCLPSLAEGISNVVLEAMASGLPVVATDVGGNRELVADRVTGTLVPSRDSATLADAIEEYFSDSSLRRRSGEAARARAVTQFSLQGMIERYHQLYALALERAGIVARAPAGASRATYNA